MTQPEIAGTPADVRSGGRLSMGGGLSRVVLLTGLALVELLALSFFYDPPYRDEAPTPLAAFLQHAGKPAVNALLLMIAAIVVINWRDRAALLQSWRASIADRSLLPWLGLNGLVLLFVIAFSIVISHDLAVYARYIVPYLMSLGVLGLTFVLALAPIHFWRDILRTTWPSILLSAVFALIALWFSGLAQAGWEPLAGATLHVSHWMLTLYENDVVMNVAAKELGVGTFVVNIAPECSGYEGMGLVLAFLGVYLFVFRRDLAFPNALVLLPIGVVTIWLLNAVRIAVLISIGAHASADVAVGGFHSQAGWIAFLLVTVGLMALSHAVPFFRRPVAASGLSVDNAAPGSAPSRSSRDDAMTWLAPFIALMAASIIAGAFVPHDKWLYGLRVVGIGFAIWLFRDFYRAKLRDRVDRVALAAGLGVGAAWIATDPATTSASELGAWLSGLPPVAAALWLAIRAAGTIVFVPIAEEFAFRGYLHRLIMTVRPAAGPVAMTLLACVISSALFGAIHQRWLAGALAGVVFALVMYRSGRISSAVVAHMAANAAIFAWALGAGQWSLL